MSSPYRAIEMRIWDDDNGESIVFRFDPHSVTSSAALDMRPKIDYAMRQLRMTGALLDELIELDVKDRAKDHSISIKRNDAANDQAIANEKGTR